MKKQIFYFAFLFVASSLLFSACKKKSDPAPVSEVELLTTLKLIFTPTAGGTSLTFTWKSPDVTSSATPTIQNISLKKNTSYNMKVEVLDETKSPAKDMTAEIDEKDTEHQFFFLRTGTGFASFAYADADSNNKPIGLTNTVVTTGTSGNNLGTLRIVLRHEPNKNASGVSLGDITNAGGSSDIDTIPTFGVSLID